MGCGGAEETARLDAEARGLLERASRQLERFGYATNDLLERLDALHERHPRHPRVTALLRRGFRVLGNRDGLIRMHRRAIAAGDRSVKRRRRLARLLNRIGRPAAAERILAPLVEAHPERVALARDLAMSRFHQQEYGAAGRLLDRHWNALEKQNPAMLYAVRGAIAYQRGRPERAAELLKRALNEDATQPRALFMLARVHAEAGRREKARELMAQAKRAKRAEGRFGHWKRRVARLAALLRDGRMQAARRELRRLRRDCRSDRCRGLLHTVRGHIHRAAGRAESARAAFEKARALLRAGAGKEPTRQTRYLAERLGRVQIGKQAQ